MKYCDGYAASLDLFVDGELTPEEMADVRAHLETCPGCRAYVDDALAIRAAFPDVEETEVPAGFAEAVCAAISARASAKKPPRKNLWLKALMPLAACLAAVIVLQNGPVSENSSRSIATPSSAPAATESAKAAPESPAAAQEEARSYALDTAAETGSAKSEAASAAGAATQDNAPAETAAAEPETQETGFSAERPVTYAARAELPAEAARFLEGFPPAEETDTEIHYHMTAEEYSTLQGQLRHAGIDYTAEAGIEPNTEEILIVLNK